VPTNDLEAEEALQSFEEPSWVIHSWNIAMHPLPPGLVDQLLSPARRKARLLRRLSELVEELVIGNVESLRWSVLQSLVQTFLINRPLVRDRLNQLLEATQEAVQRTLEKRRTLQQSSAPELERLQGVLGELRRLQASLRQPAASQEKAE